MLPPAAPDELEPLFDFCTRNTHPNISTHQHSHLPNLSGQPQPIMADVDMTDAPPVAKKKGSDAEAKKRFEVKKVSMGAACD